MKALSFFTILLPFIFLSSCNQVGSKAENTSGDYTNFNEREPLIKEDVPAQSGSDKSLPVYDEKKIIKTGNLTLETTSLKTYRDKLLKTLPNYGAYIARESIENNNYNNVSDWQISVPVKNFELLMTALEDMDSTRMVNRSISTDDVTHAWFDTRGRLEAKLQMRQKYMEFLKQSKNTTDMLQVQRELNFLQEEIESVTGRIDAMAKQSTYSTINLTVKDHLIGAIPEPETPGFLTRALEAFNNGAVVLTAIILAAVTIWPILLISAIIIVFLKIRKAKPTIIRK